MFDGNFGEHQFSVAIFIQSANGRYEFRDVDVLIADPHLVCIGPSSAITGPPRFQST